MNLRDKRMTRRIGITGNATMAAGERALIVGAGAGAGSARRWPDPAHIHVGHIVIDGGIGKAGDPRANERGPDGLLDPDAIAETYCSCTAKPRSAWAWEIEPRPWVENF